MARSGTRVVTRRFDARELAPWRVSQVLTRLGIRNNDRSGARPSATVLMGFRRDPAPLVRHERLSVKRIMSRFRYLAAQIIPSFHVQHLLFGQLCLCTASLMGSASGQAPDPEDSTKVLNLTTFATFSAVNNSGAIDLTHPKDGSGRVFVSTNEGKIHAFSSTGTSLGTFLDLNASGVLPDFDSSLGFTTRGLSYMAFHPDYGKADASGEGKFYSIYKTDEPGLRSPDYSAAELPTKPGNVLSQYAITEWTVDSNDPNQIDTSSRREVIRFEFSGPSEDTHSVGQLAFNPFALPSDPDYGNLYIPLGDNYAGGTIPNWQHVQDEDNPFGKILRINPLENGGDAYSIPVDNPFNNGGILLDNDNNSEEIAAWGFRYPQNMSFAKDSSGNARLVVFDIGADNFEEVNIVDIGDNHGWTHHDGPVEGNLSTTLNLPPGATLEFPATVYDHTFPVVPGATATAGSAAISGGFVVSDPNDPNFYNQVLFSDLARGAFFHADFDELVTADAADSQAAMFVMDASLNGSAPGAFPSLIGSQRGDARFGVDESGRLFVISRRTNTIFVSDLIADQNPVPEPSTLALSAIALAVLSGYRGGRYYWSTYPDINPYTGRMGTRNTPSYNS